MIENIAFLTYLLGHIRGATNSLKLMSTAFPNKGVVPLVYTCEGKDKSIPLRWKGVPFQTQSLVVIMKDVDAPNGKGYQWIMYNIPPQLSGLKPDLKKLSQGEKLGCNSWGEIRYEGPCPTLGSTDHYVIELYALDTLLHINMGADMTTLQKAMHGHVIGNAEIMGDFTNTSS